MLTKIFSIFAFTLLFFATAGSSYASTSVRLQSPAGQTNQQSLNLTFVALDTDSTQTVGVNCWSKGPSDASFSVFQTFSLPNGGNTSVCNATLNEGYGMYGFYVTAAGTGTSTSSTVSTNYNNSFPDTPINYRKEKTDSCTYKISFRTANDSGKTTSVVLYRSSSSDFPLDDAHKVSTQSIGSDTDGYFTNDISPNCNSDYFYALRAFDAYGNASGAIGDSNTISVVITPTGAASGAQTQGAIAINENKSAIGASPTEEKNKSVLGTSSQNTNEKKGEGTTSPLNWISGHKKISLTVLVLIVAGAYLAFRFRKSQKS